MFKKIPLLGGKKSTASLNLSDIGSTTLRKTYNIINSIDPKRSEDVLRFYQGYHQVIEQLSETLDDRSTVCYVVGNRTVKKIFIETDIITSEIFENFRFKHKTTQIRDIPNKRMPSKNSPTNVKGEKITTMVNEYVVVLQR